MTEKQKLASYLLQNDPELNPEREDNTEEIARLFKKNKQTITRNIEKIENKLLKDELNRLKNEYGIKSQLPYNKDDRWK